MGPSQLDQRQGSCDLATIYYSIVVLQVTSCTLLLYCTALYCTVLHILFVWLKMRWMAGMVESTTNQGGLLLNSDCDEETSSEGSALTTIAAAAAAAAAARSTRALLLQRTEKRLSNNSRESRPVGGGSEFGPASGSFRSKACAPHLPFLCQTHLTSTSPPPHLIKPHHRVNNPLLFRPAYMPYSPT